MRATQRARIQHDAETVVCAEVRVNALTVQLVVRGPESQALKVHKLTEVLTLAIDAAMPSALLEVGA